MKTMYEVMSRTDFQMYDMAAESDERSLFSRSSLTALDATIQAQRLRRLVAQRVQTADLNKLALGFMQDQKA